jgi:hypothetical protein
MMSSKWQDATEIYNVKNNVRNFTKQIYRTSNGFEAFIVGEATSETENDCWLIEGNGVKSKVWKNTTKNKIVKVSNDYQLRCFTYSNK